jgi:hypothetical protein
VRHDLPAGMHVLELVGGVGAHDAAARILPLAAALAGSGDRVSVLCDPQVDSIDVLRTGGCELLLTPVDDDPDWTSMRLAATWVAHERVGVLHAHGSAAHVLSVIVGALTGRPCAATVPFDDIPMLDFEAHRLTDGTHLLVGSAGAFDHARAIGVADRRLHRCDGPDGGVSCTVSVLRTLAAAAERA